MRRILYLSKDGDMGGSQRQLFLLLTHLDRREFEPVVVCHEENAGAEALRRAGIETHVFAPPAHPLLSFAQFHLYVRRLAALAFERKVSLIHGNKLELNPHVISAARRIGAPSVIHVRSAVAPAPSGGRQRALSLKGRVRRVVLRAQEHLVTQGYQRTDALIAISPRLQRELLLAGVPEEKIALINDCVDLGSFCPGISEGNLLRSQYPRSQGLLVGLVGRLEPFKRQLDFLRAAAHIVRAGQHAVTFFLIGKTIHRSYHRQVLDFINQQGLSQHVILTGGCEGMPQLIGSLDVLVSLSGGSVMYEGMASGKPVLSAGYSTAETAVHLHDGKTGLVVSSRGEQELVSALTRLLDDAGLRQSLGRQARAWAEQNLSHLGMVASVQSIYRKLLGS